MKKSKTDSSLDYASGKWPQLSILSALCSGTVLDSVKVSDSEEVSDQDTGSSCRMWGKFCVVFWKCIYIAN